MGVSLDQLSYFVAVAEEGNIGRAARRLRISQPPLSRQIRSLEHELGVELFRRTTQGVQLLPAGHQLLPRVRHILEAVDGVRGLAREVDSTPPRQNGADTLARRRAPAQRSEGRVHQNGDDVARSSRTRPRISPR